MLWSLPIALGYKLWGFNVNLDWHAMSSTMSMKHLKKKKQLEIEHHFLEKRYSSHNILLVSLTSHIIRICFSMSVQV